MIAQGSEESRTRDVNESTEETAPLLRSIESSPSVLPWRQLIVIAVMRLSEPISFNLIFPFINEMIKSLDIAHDQESVGYYSGVIEGLFAFWQFCTVLFWGRLSDRLGRRPVVLLGLCGCILSTASFGLSRSFWMMVVTRSLSGVLNGNTAVFKSMIGEMTDRTNQARAFSVMPLCWATGSVVAPLIGGFLSRPAERFPNVFGRWQLFIDYPYLLPCLTGAAISTIGLIAGFFLLEETLGGKIKTATVEISLADSETSPQPQYSILDLLRMKPIRAVLIGYAFLAFVVVSEDALLVLWLYTPLASGGIGFNPSEIGTTLAFNGVIAICVSVLIFPPLDYRIGTLAIYRAAVSLHPFVILMFPIAHHLALGQAKSFSVFGVAVLVLLRCFGGVVFACNMILVTRAVPNRASLGTVNGMAQMVASLSRAIGPPVSSSLFAVSMSRHLIEDNFVWICMLLPCLAWVISTRYITDEKSESRP